MVSNAIETVALKKFYGSHMAVNHVSLIVRPGEIFGFLGPNGAGKSTVVKMLLGLVNPTAGTARLLGRSYRDPSVRRQIGYLPELFRFPPWLLVQEVLTWHQKLAGLMANQDQARDILAQVGLEGRELHRVKSLSKGLQQRLGLAVALVGDPQLLFLDEPTSAMDPLGRHEMAQLFRTIRDSGRTIFLNSHLLSDMEHLCDRLALIDHGNILYTGTLQAVLDNRHSGYRIFLDQLPESCVEELSRHDLSLHPMQKYWHFPYSRDRLPVLHRILAHHGANVYEVEKDKKSLEDWFIESLKTDEAPSLPANAPDVVRKDGNHA